MDQEKKETPKISKSKYELTLAEFPLFLLSKGGKEDKAVFECIEYRDMITGKGGEEVPRVWKVYPHSQIGFGTASTFETLFDLFQVWKEHNFDNQYIQFGSVYNLLKKRGENTGNNDYKRIIRDLNCLVGITIEAKNAFWDNEVKAYVDMTFHIFDNLYLYKEKPTGQAVLPFSSIKASDVLYGSVQKNSLLMANFDSHFFHSLTPVEQRLALYLSKVFRSQSVNKRELLHFAQQIPLYAKQTKHIKEQFKKACRGLMEKGFDLLERLSFEKGVDGKELIIFERKGKLPEYPKGGPQKEHYEIDLLVEDILEVCDDKKSTDFYKKVARLLPRETIYRALAEVREVKNLSGVKKSEGALFTSLVRKYARDLKVEL